MKKIIATIVLLCAIAMTYGQKTKILEMRDGKDTVFIPELYLMNLVSNAEVKYQCDTTVRGGTVKTFKFTFKDTAIFKVLYISSNEVFKKGKRYKIKYIELDAVKRPWNIDHKHLKKLEFLWLKLDDFMNRY